MTFVRRLWRVLGFLAYFAWEFLVANAEVLWEILRPHPAAAPAIVAVPLRCRTRLEVVAMANLITLTPGTLTVEVTEDPPALYVHGMFAGEPDRFIAGMHALEDRLLAAIRPTDPEGR